MLPRRRQHKAVDGICSSFSFRIVALILARVSSLRKGSLCWSLALPPSSVKNSLASRRGARSALQTKADLHKKFSSWSLAIDNLGRQHDGDNLSLLQYPNLHHSNPNLAREQECDDEDATIAATPPSLTNQTVAHHTFMREDKYFNWTRSTVDLAIPALVGMIADPLLSLMDTFYTAKLGSIPLAALGACTSIFHLAFNAFRATTAATTSLVASALVTSSASSSPSGGTVLNYYRPNEEAQMVLSRSIQVTTLLGVLVSAFLYIYSRQSLQFMGINLTSKLYPYATSYLRVRCLAAPAVLFITVAEGAFRGYGDTKTPLYASLLAAVINAIMDPIMMFSLRMGVGGAAAATALSQIVAAGLYLWLIRSRGMLLGGRVETVTAKGSILLSKGTDLINGVQNRTFSNRNSLTKAERETLPPKRVPTKTKVFTAIISANLAMMLKQGSLLLAWAYATRCATKIGHQHVAAHQVALSLWLIFALVQDGAAVAAQVLMSQACAYSVPSTASAGYESDDQINGSEAQRDLPRIRSLTRYMTRLAIYQSIVCSILIYAIGRLTPSFFGSDDPLVRYHLQSLIPIITVFQPLVSLTLVWESLVVGANMFKLLAIGTTVATLWSMYMMSGASSIAEIWKKGLVSLFVGRLLTSVLGVGSINNLWSDGKRIIRNGSATFARRRCFK